MNIEDYKRHKTTQLIRSNSTYNVYDCKDLKNLSLSLTELHPKQYTGGHSHEEADEVYVFISGRGKIQIGKNFLSCREGDVFLIPRGDFHKVWNRGIKSKLKFWSIFEKYGERK